MIKNIMNYKYSQYTNICYSIFKWQLVVVSVEIFLELTGVSSTVQSVIAIVI